MSGGRPRKEPQSPGGVGRSAGLGPHKGPVLPPELTLALPLSEPFPQALESLNKKDIGEIKSYGRPPAQVEIVMQAVMILRGNEPTWAESKRQLGKPERGRG